MLPISFVMLALVLALILYAGISRIAYQAFPDNDLARRFISRGVLLLAVWLIYASVLSLAGVFIPASMPPRIPLLLVLPAFALMLYFFASGRFNAVIGATPLSWLLYLQSFRIVVELLIYWCFLQGVLPREGTFRGNNFDIIFGLTAPLIGYSAGNRKRGVQLNLLAWNCFGLLSLAIVVFTLISSAYFPAMWGLRESILSNGLGRFPFTLLAGFFMPLAVFLHVFSIVKIRQRVGRPAD